MSEGEQAKEIRRLLDAEHRKATPFDILGVDIATCEVADVNRAFRKIALLLHPDKCKLPSATSAFHVAERAHKTLSQETVLAHLRRADAKRREREAEAPTHTHVPQGRKPAPGAPATAAAQQQPPPPASPPSIPFGSLSKLAPSGLSDDAQKAAEIARILACKPTDYFIILDVNPAEAEVVDVDRRYRRLAQALHPDKCALPRVTDAFMVFEKAHKELADEKKLIRFRLAFQQQQKREAALAAEAARRTAASCASGGAGAGGVSSTANMTAEERREVRKQEMLREHQLQSARLADEAARKRQRQAQEDVERAELSADLERQRKEWRDLNMF